MSTSATHRRFNVSDIQWDADAAGAEGLPDEMTFRIPVADIESEDDITDLLAEAISAEIGFCTKGFSFDELLATPAHPSEKIEAVAASLPARIGKARKMLFAAIVAAFESSGARVVWFNDPVEVVVRGENGPQSVKVRKVLWEPDQEAISLWEDGAEGDDCHLLQAVSACSLPALAVATGAAFRGV